MKISTFMQATIKVRQQVLNSQQKNTTIYSQLGLLTKSQVRLLNAKTRIWYSFVFTEFRQF